MSAEKSSFFIVILGLFCFFFSPIQAQFSPGHQDINTTAIHKNDTSFSFWANEVFIERGWQNIADTTLGKSTFGTESNVIGQVDNSIISLGDKGVAIIQFPFAIHNIVGYDFAVFENGFAQTGAVDNEYFLELATVAVSENGIDFIEFESTSNTNTSTQVGSFASINCTNLNNIAGKYPANYGTPFDIEELGLDSILAIKITDVIGTININFASYDSQGNIINDPHPTAFGSCGFDLDAVGALNQPNKDTSIIPIDSTGTNIYTVFKEEFTVYPNPVKQNSSFNVLCAFRKNNDLEIFSLMGKKIFSTTFKKQINIRTEGVEKGIYFVRINKIFIQKIIIH